MVPWDLNPLSSVSLAQSSNQRFSSSVGLGRHPNNSSNRHPDNWQHKARTHLHCKSSYPTFVWLRSAIPPHKMNLRMPQEHQSFRLWKTCYGNNGISYHHQLQRSMGVRIWGKKRHFRDLVKRQKKYLWQRKKVLLKACFLSSACWSNQGSFKSKCLPSLNPVHKVDAKNWDIKASRDK